MTLTPTDLAAIAIVLVAVIYLYRRDDPRAWNWVRAQCSRLRKRSSNS